MARKKASHPPPPSPKKLRSVIETGMMNIENIPKDTDDFDPTGWKLFNHDDKEALPDILKTVENNLKNLDWQLHDAARDVGGTGWYLWKRTEGQDSQYLVWFNLEGDEWDNMSLMTMVPDEGTSRQLYGKERYSIDDFLVTRVHQHDTWGHQGDFEYTIILPTDENKMWVPLFPPLFWTMNWKRFPKVLLEGA